MSIPNTSQPFWLTIKNISVEGSYGSIAFVKTCLEFISATENGGYYRIKNYLGAYNWDTRYSYSAHKGQWNYFLSRGDIQTELYNSGVALKQNFLVSTKNSLLKNASNEVVIGYGAPSIDIPVLFDYGASSEPESELQAYEYFCSYFEDSEWFEVPCDDTNDGYLFLPYNNITLYARTEAKLYLYPTESDGEGTRAPFFRNIDPTDNYLDPNTSGSPYPIRLFPKIPNIQNPSFTYPNNTFADASVGEKTTFKFRFSGGILGMSRLYIKNNLNGEFVHSASASEPWVDESEWISSGAPTIYNGDEAEIEITLNQPTVDPEGDITNGGQYIWYLDLYEYNEDISNNWRNSEKWGKQYQSVYECYADNAIPYTTSSYYFETLAPMAMEFFTDPADVFVYEELSSKNLEVSGVYSHPQNVPLKWYQFILREGEDDAEVIKDTGRIYSERISFVYDGFLSHKFYELTIKAENQKNQTIEISYSFETTYETPSIYDGTYTCEDSVLSDIQVVSLTFDLMAIPHYDNIQGFKIFRSKRFDMYETPLGDYTVTELTQKALVEGSGSVFCIYDHLTRSNDVYSYSIFPYVMDEGKPIFITPYTVINDITQDNEAYTDWQGYSLIPLEKEGYNKFAIPSTYGKQYPFWTFFVDREESEITQNQDKETFTTFAPFPKISVGMLNYETGNLSFKLGNTACDGRYLEPYELLEKWKKFIALNKICLLKNPKGDMKIVSIDPNSTREYMNEASNYSVDDRGMITAYPTTINFSYTEIAKVEDVDIRVSLLDGDQYL